MIIESLILIIGLFASYIFIKTLYPDQTLIKLIVSTVTIFMSLLILSGYYLDRFGIPVFSIYTIMIFLFMAIAVLLKNRQVLHSDIKIDKQFTLGFIFIFVIGFIVLILPALPSFFPVGRITDSAMHYAYSSYIARNGFLWLNESPFALFPEWNTYPFGLHLNVAFMSKVLNVDPITVLYPFIVSISVLTAAIVYGIVIESKTTNIRLFGLLPSFIALSFYLSMDMVRVQATWSMGFGIFLVLMFVWLTMDYIKNPGITGLLPLVLVEVAVVFSYPYWAAIPAITFLFVLLFNKDIKLSRKDMLLQVSIFSLLVGVLVVDYMMLTVTMAKNVIGAGDYKLSFVRFLPFDFFGWRIREPNPFIIDLINLAMTIFFALAILGAAKSLKDRKNIFPLYFFAAALLQTLILAMGVFFLDFRVYPYSKAYYLLTYPAAIFFFIGLKYIITYLNISAVFKDSKPSKALFITILVASVILSGQLVTIGVRMTGNQELAISPDQYDVALWTKNNLPEGPLNYLGATPQDLWFYVISSHDPADPEMVLGPPLDEYFNKWNSRAKEGEIVVLMDTQRIESVNVSNFNILYKKGNSVVLKKNVSLENVR